MTILELLLATALMSLFVSTVYETVIIGLRQVGTGDDRETIRGQLTQALDLMTREASLASNVDNAEDQRLQFDADLDGNGTTENNINYQVVSGALQRQYNGTSVTLITNATSFDFDFTDLNGANMTTPVAGGSLHDIRVAKITATATKNNDSLSVAGSVFFRNNR
ncbi:MAG: hypothetical protein HYZ92_05260 [Candidatus Omnitrophica bacterium]|nr:hypothetical protein [Candidatus Omnitrophota bacterium]